MNVTTNKHVKTESSYGKLKKTRAERIFYVVSSIATLLCIAASLIGYYTRDLDVMHIGFIGLFVTFLLMVITHFMITDHNRT